MISDLAIGQLRNTIYAPSVRTMASQECSGFLSLCVTCHALQFMLNLPSNSAEGAQQDPGLVGVCTHTNPYVSTHVAEGNQGTLRCTALKHVCTFAA